MGEGVLYSCHDLTVNEVKTTIADLSIKKSENKEHVPQQHGSSHLKKKSSQNFHYSILMNMPPQMTLNKLLYTSKVKKSFMNHPVVK